MHLARLGNWPISLLQLMNLGLSLHGFLIMFRPPLNVQEDSAMPVFFDGIYAVAVYAVTAGILGK